MKLRVFDIEANGLTPDKIHCLCADIDGDVKGSSKYAHMRKLLAESDVLVGHNIIRYDIPVLERILGVEVKAKLVDTLALSWYLEPERSRHGLADYGEEYGIPKPKVDDWEGLTTEEYLHRCTEDVKINARLWKDQWKQLMKIYGSEDEVWRFIDYISFKLDCAREQEKWGWKLDLPKAEELERKLSTLSEGYVEELRSKMPKKKVYTTKTKPAKMYKQNGELSANGVKWKALCEEQGVSIDSESITYISSYGEPNPNSVDQLKQWLFDLGWKPCTYKFVRNKKTGETRQVPQLRKKDGDNLPILTPSVEVLADKIPEIRALKDLGVVNHRLTVVKGFLENVQPDGFVQAQIKGLTNTLRFKHTVIVNLPAPDKPYGADLRGCLLRPSDDMELCGSDMSSLEDRTKQHYMYDYDPKYVEELMTDDFDAHLDICLEGNLLTQAQVDAHKAGTENHSGQRKKGKATNYACVYGAGGATVARSAGISELEGNKLVEAYWKRNWAVKAIAENTKVKVANKRKWQYNPVSGFWYSLRHDKDRFSTLNQGTGVYCFDSWVKEVRKGGLITIGQFHDEIIVPTPIGAREKVTQFLKDCVGNVNKQLKLNRTLDIDVQFGVSYAGIH